MFDNLLCIDKSPRRSCLRPTWTLQASNIVCSFDSHPIAVMRMATQTRMARVLCCGTTLEGFLKTAVIDKDDRTFQVLSAFQIMNGLGKLSGRL